MSERVEGVVKFFDKDKGYGFIRRKGEPDIFLHAAALRKSGIETVNKGDRVVFEVVILADSKGRGKAANISLLSQ